MKKSAAGTTGERRAPEKTVRFSAKRRFNAVVPPSLTFDTKMFKRRADSSIPGGMRFPVVAFEYRGATFSACRADSLYLTARTLAVGTSLFKMRSPRPSAGRESAHRSEE